jgi:hypothetical protein
LRDRRQKAKYQSSLPLVILAGLPHPVASATIKWIEGAFHNSLRVVSTPASGNDGSLYSEQNITQLLRTTVEYAQRQAKLHNPLPAPSQLWLAYVPSPDEEQLLSCFDFAAFPVKLRLLADYKEGRQLRHDLTASREEITSQLHGVVESFHGIKRRLSTFSQKEPLFLPGKNFLVSPGHPLSEIFCELRAETRPWSDVLSEAQSVSATHDDLPRHIKNGVQRAIFTDSRGLLFPRDPSMHGAVREISANPTAMEHALFLRSCFRFGVPLPAGLHHDVQFPRRKLSGTPFECSIKGHINLTCDYANVYPDDFVRPSQ